MEGDGMTTAHSLAPATFARAVAEAFDMPPSFAISQSRTQAAAYARFALFKLLRTHKRMLSLESIGTICGNRDHGTVMHGLKRADELMQTEPAFKDAYERAERSLLTPTT
jgi:chromosomal replication initiation ATPase DnaA